MGTESRLLGESRGTYSLSSGKGQKKKKERTLDEKRRSNPMIRATIRAKLISAAVSAPAIISFLYDQADFVRIEFVISVKINHVAPETSTRDSIIPSANV